LLLLWIATLVAAALEMVGIGAIPAFVALITDPGRLMAMLPGETLPRLVAETDTATLTLVGAGVLTGAFLLKNIYVAALVFVENRMLRDHTVVLSDRLFRAYLYSPYIFHLGTNSAHLVRNIGTEVTTAVQTIRSAMLALREGLVLVVMFLLLLLIDPLISLSVFLVLTAAAAGFYIAVRRRLAARGRLAQEHRARQVQVINQAFGAIKDVKILGRESYLAAVLDRETAGKEHHEFFQRVIGAFPRLFLEVVGIGSVLLVAAMFVVLGRSASTMLPVLTLLAVAVVRMVPAFNAITTSLAGMRFSWPSFELVARELERLPPPPPSADGTAAVRAPFTAVLSMHDVGFAYPGSDSPVLRGIDLEIRRGEVVAFIGPSGSGKTTLVNLLMGLLTPTVGRIRMDGRDVAEGGAGWRRQVGYIPQDLYLLDDSVRRNIAFGLPDGEIDDAAVAGAVRAAQIEDLVAALPQGLDTFIGERGARLSGGQRQRIAIARALYHDPPVLVLDEATAALDSETEGAVIDAINRLRGDRTIIIIAHRMSTVARCDRVYLLRDGQIVDAGTFAELRRRHPHVESDALADVAGDGTPPERVEIT
ncbi:MAG TPA: ABC transporter ATP-binding protein, partial [Longimicrobiales bacterium]|nr:ABC transporter ATP-binding protein [Longimicrobiales bacterium]